MKCNPSSGSSPLQRMVYPPTWLRQRRAEVKTATNQSDSASRPSDSPEKATLPIRTVGSDELLRGDRELRIAHGDDVYRLLLTRNNKLILQK